MPIQSTFHTLQTALLGVLAWLAGPEDKDPSELADDPEADRAELLDPLELVDNPDVSAADLNDVYVEDIEVFGPGCPQGTVTSTVASNRRSFLVSYSRMALAHPSPAGGTLQSTSCALALKLHVPQGVQVSVATVVTRGYAYLDPGIRARQTSKYTFGGTSIRVRRDLPADFDGHYDLSDQLPFWSQGWWSSCGGSAVFVIDSRLQLDAQANPAGEAFFNTVATDGRFNTRYQLRWRKC
ncbi:DUF4360 domain-containing protein [Nannocystis radixulma]|uniref:DUF4360 domain-containing protein n=1 Tax=Nannocystis radixulma TaxID=2995305 RepID=A0ABT5B1V2_9BACT|nr:DUF4360 domain-containing protein [Nannocystis radixulma]MDC0668081.1 DUF4360 domain-containing protein [Nannocystis radixulma]